MTQSASSRLPLIPLSPLINTSSQHAKVLAELTQSLSEEGTPSLKNNLEKTMIKEREKLDRLTKNMQMIQNSVLSQFPITEVAKEIAYIDSSLFRIVSLNEQWLCNFDKQSNIVPLVDFHRYLSHSFAHQIIMHSERNKSVKKPSSIVGELIQIAYILMTIYRDFSGCTAILTCLQMPEIQRLDSIWNVCPSKLLNLYKDLVLMLSPHNDYAEYYRQFTTHTSPLMNITPIKSQMVAIPFMHAHLATLRTIINTHASSTIHQQNVVLSSTGQARLASCVHLLEFCQQHATLEALPERKRASSSSKRSSVLRLSMSPCLDLDQVRSNPNIYHWLVSRAYLNRHQLHIESLAVEPLAVGEIELEPEEEHDLFWDFFSEPERPPTKSKRQREEEEVSDLEIPTVLSPAAAEFIPDSSVLSLEDDDEEEWTGYPMDSNEEEEEEWTGYPIQDDEEDEDEIWRGYPIPQEERTSPAEFSSPSTPPQEGQEFNDLWKPNVAIGKAAARRMQYSVSNTDTTRKRLPSTFAPSSST